MSIVLAIAGVFVGIGGPGAERVDRQVETLVHREAETGRAELEAGERPTLMREGVSSERIVRRLDTDAVVVGWLTDELLELVVYDRAGRAVDRISQGAPGGALDRDGLDALRRTLILDLQQLAASGAIVRTDEIELEPADEPAPVAEEPVAEEPVAEEPVADEEPAADDEPAADEPAADEPAADEATAVDDTTFEDDEPYVEPHLGLRLGAGISFLARDFSATPTGVVGYGAAAVPALSLAGRVTPLGRLALTVALDRTVGMSTEIDAHAVATTMTRWQAAGHLAIRDGALAVAAIGGLGRNDLVIDSKSPARSPDAHYGYLMLGAEVAMALGTRTTLHGHGALEPVVTGEQPTMTTLGDARRWAIELGAGVELALPHHLRVEVDASVQRFAWSWPEAGARGAGGAVDRYPSARIAIDTDL